MFVRQAAGNTLAFMIPILHLAHKLKIEGDPLKTDRVMTNLVYGVNTSMLILC